jgi:hypothetical protein
VQTTPKLLQKATNESESAKECCFANEVAGRIHAVVLLGKFMTFSLPAMAVTLELSVALSACNKGVLAVTSTTVDFDSKVPGDPRLEAIGFHTGGVVSSRE